jgi:hypothetical protein
MMVYKKIKTIKDNFINKNENMSNYIKVTPSDTCGMKYAPLTTVDIECTLSCYKLTLKSNRCSFKFENF